VTIAPGERRPVVEAALLLFLGLSAYYVLKPVRSSLFLHEFPAEDLPRVNLLTMAVTFAAAWVFERLTLRTRLDRLAPAVLLFFAANVVLLWVLLRRPVEARGATVAFYVWVSVFNLFTPALAWSLAHRVFDPGQGRRLYGLIGGGATAGALAGSVVSNRLAELIGTEGLLPVAALLLIPAAALARRLARRGTRAAAPAAAPRADARSGLAMLFGNPTVRGIALIVFCYTALASLLDFQTLSTVQARIAEKDARTAWLGGLFLTMNLLCLAIQLLVTGPVQVRFGPLPGLLSLPFANTIASLAFLASPGLAVVGVCAVVDQALTYSIHQSSKELLYLPAGEAVKVRAKAFVDTFVFRAGSAAAALVLLLWNQALPGGVRWLAVLIVPAAVAWGVVAVRLARRFEDAQRPKSMVAEPLG
jgi:AAA family ATP:ADP antiporter